MTVRSIFLPLLMVVAIGCYDKEETSTTGEEVESSGFESSGDAEGEYDGGSPDDGEDGEEDDWDGEEDWDDWDDWNDWDDEDNGNNWDDWHCGCLRGVRWVDSEIQLT